MRPIKFRGLSAKTKEWVYGYYSVFTYEAQGGDYPRDETGRFIMPIKGDNEQREEDEYIRVIPESVGLLTGFIDKNGKEIYEGDKVIILSGETAIVVFRNGAFMLEWVGMDLYAELMGWIDFKRCIEYSGESFEIIGSIHTHPELLSNTQVK